MSSLEDMEYTKAALVNSGWFEADVSELLEDGELYSRKAVLKMLDETEATQPKPRAKRLSKEAVLSDV